MVLYMVIEGLREKQGLGDPTMVPEIKILGQRSRRQECEQWSQKQLEEQQLRKKMGFKEMNGSLITYEEEMVELGWHREMKVG